MSQLGTLFIFCFEHHRIVPQAPGSCSLGFCLCRHHAPLHTRRWKLFVNGCELCFLTTWCCERIYSLASVTPGCSARLHRGNAVWNPCGLR